MLAEPEPFVICSADAVVYRILGSLHMSEKCISLEQLLSDIGLGRRVPVECSNSFRQEFLKKGFAEGLWSS
jgi:hypothetical protein